MQQYNTNLSKIQLPEYGRNIESLIKYCMTIPERKRRTRFAYGIINFMARVKNDDNPTISAKKVYWDHLALLSNFELDIDYPYEIIKKENLDSKPDKIEVHVPRIRFRQYGKIVEEMINKALQMTDAAKRLRLLELCANHMKLQFILANKNADEDDNKIIHDLVDYVGPDLAPECYKVYLYSAKELMANEQYSLESVKKATNPSSSKKKKKKKKKKK